MENNPDSPIGFAMPCGASTTPLARKKLGGFFDRLSDPYQPMARLLYGSGLRLMECVQLRVEDVDFAQRQIIVRNGKRMNDRVTTHPGDAS
jgi:integrase